MANCLVSAFAVIDASASERQPFMCSINGRTPSARITGKSGGRDCFRNDSTSSIAPWRSITSNRVSQRAIMRSRSGIRVNNPARFGSMIGMPGCCCQKCSDLLVASTTSNARVIRCVSVGTRRAAMMGSSIASNSWSFAAPKRCASERQCRRTSSAISGIGDNPSSSALKYKPVPPTMIARSPRSRASA